MLASRPEKFQKPVRFVWMFAFLPSHNKKKLSSKLTQLIQNT